MLLVVILGCFFYLAVGVLMAMSAEAAGRFRQICQRRPTRLQRAALLAAFTVLWLPIVIGGSIYELCHGDIKAPPGAGER